MERKKRYDKPAINGHVADRTSGQSGDTNFWDREAEQQQGCVKKLVSMSTSESPSQHCPPLFNWSLPQHPPTAQQHFVNTIMPQPHNGQPTQQQGAAPAQGPVQGGLQVLPVPWQNLDGGGQGVGSIQAPPLSGAGESDWPQATGASGSRPPPFGFPPLPYAGAWDQSSWWGHNPYPPPVPYMYPGCGSWYPYPIPPTPPIGANQRGFIKLPSGLSQKHHRVWKAQSMENMQLWTMTTQLWAAVARADAEIAVQRTKILKLEAELQMVKGHQDGHAAQAEDTTATLPSGGHRGRRKVTTAALDTTAVSAPGSDTLQTSGKKVRQIIDKAVSSMNSKQMDSEVKEKYPCGNHAPEVLYRLPPMDEGDRKCCSPIVGLRNESVIQKHSLRQTLEFQSPTNSSINSSVTIARDESAFSHSTHLNSLFKPNSSSLLGGRKVRYEQPLKEIAGVSFLKNAGNGLDHPGVIIGDIPYGASMSNGGMCTDSNGTMMTADVVRSQVQAQFNVENMEKAHLLSIPKPNSSWRYTVEDGSDEHEKGGASIQDDDNDDDDMDDEDEEAALEEIHNDKVGNLWHTVPFR